VRNKSGLLKSNICIAFIKANYIQLVRKSLPLMRGKLNQRLGSCVTFNIYFRKTLFHWKIETIFFFHLNPEILANLFNLIYYLILTLTQHLSLAPTLTINPT